jgi:predicted lipoprotein with Yx(FWY)xxD motif
MNNSNETRIVHGPRRGRPSGLAITAAVSTLALGACVTAMAVAASTTPTVSSASSSTLGEQIVVNAHGHTLYALSPETTHHLLCKGRCFAVWPPLTVSSRKTKLRAGSGVHGSLGILRRSNGMLQVTLRGLPLYRYAGDSAAGQANGQGIHSFGGTWHAMTASTDAGSAPATNAPTTPGGYGEPSSSGTPTSTSTTPAATTPSTPTTNTPTTTNPTTTTPTTPTPTYPKEEKKEESW